MIRRFAALLAAAALLAVGACGVPASSSTTTEQAPAKQTKSKTQEAEQSDGLVGVVSEHTEDGLEVIPFSDDPPTDVPATASERKACTVGEKYPHCLPE